MDVAIRPLDVGDIEQVREIEREAFSTALSANSFRREMGNPRSTYLVAWERQEGPGPAPVVDTSPILLSWIASGFGHLLGHRKAIQASPDRILGYVGMWHMGPEAHITAIAVGQQFRGQGIGELLLLSSIESAMNRRAEAVSLEVRVSNQVAQSLYEKYGFAHVGIRKAYYSNDREDAAIMTTEPISSAEYQQKFRQLREAFQHRRGEIRMCLA